MEINKLVDLNNFRTAPKLSNSQAKRILEELEANIFNADWITIGIMAPSDNKAIEALQSISKKYSSIKFGNLGSLHADGGVFLKANQNTIVIHTRNNYEVSIGTFQNSINPNTENFSEFPKWVDDHLDTLLENKESTNIAMFCTGGIRCEKATSLLKKKGYKNIYHLKGGILQYLDDIPEEKNLFEGECYVFDKRVALDQELERGSYSICHA